MESQHPGKRLFGFANRQNYCGCILLNFTFSKLLQISLCILKLFGSGADAGKKLAITNARKHQILFANAIVRALSTTVGYH